MAEIPQGSLPDGYTAEEWAEYTRVANAAEQAKEDQRRAQQRDKK